MSRDSQVLLGNIAVVQRPAPCLDPAPHDGYEYMETGAGITAHQ